MGRGYRSIGPSGEGFHQFRAECRQIVGLRHRVTGLEPCATPRCSISSRPVRRSGPTGRCRWPGAASTISPNSSAPRSWWSPRTRFAPVREYLAAFRSRWPYTEVAFASKAFPCTAIQRLMSQEGLLLDVAGGERSSPRWPRAPIRPECCCTVTPNRRGVGTGRRQRHWSGGGGQLRRHRPAGAHRRTRAPAGMSGAGDPRCAGRHSRGGRHRHAARSSVCCPRTPEAAIAGSGAAGCCAATACTPTWAHNCSTPISWPPRWPHRRTRRLRRLRLRRRTRGPLHLRRPSADRRCLRADHDRPCPRVDSRPVPASSSNRAAR